MALSFHFKGMSLLLPATNGVARVLAPILMLLLRHKLLLRVPTVRHDVLVRPLRVRPLLGIATIAGVSGICLPHQRQTATGHSPNGGARVLDTTLMMLLPNKLLLPYVVLVLRATSSTPGSTLCASEAPS